MKSKFQVGDLVKASSKITKGVYTKWGKANRPIDCTLINDELKKTLQNTDVGMIVEKKKSWYGRMEYEIKFMKTGLTIILPEEQVKWAK
jgi:hypothetical protein